jgi:hypothetical protein
MWSCRNPANHEDTSLIVETDRLKWLVNDVEDLKVALTWRDSRGGAWFWLSPENAEHPLLCIRITGDLADVIFFPEEGHPGFRCLGGEGMLEGEYTTLVYEGCDPRAGEETPNEFIVPLSTAYSVASEFLRSERRSEAVSWLEL